MKQNSLFIHQGVNESMTEEVHLKMLTIHNTANWIYH